MATSIICPNCHQACPGLYSNEAYGVPHCGCFYEADPSDVAFHADTAVPLPSFFLDGILSLVSHAPRGLCKSCVETLSARLHQLVTASYGTVDLRDLLLPIERTAK